MTSKKSPTSAEVATPPACAREFVFTLHAARGTRDFVIGYAHLSQNSSLRGVEVEKETPEKVLVLHQLLPRSRRDVTTGTATSQRDVLHPVPGYPASARSDIVQALVIARWYIVDGLRGASAGLLRRRVRIVRALQIHVSDAAAAAEDVRHTLHDASLPTSWKTNGRFTNTCIILYTEEKKKRTVVSTESANSAIIMEKIFLVQNVIETNNIGTRCCTTCTLF